MKEIHKKKITAILEDIKSRSSLIGGGSGNSERREFRDVHTIWELGLAIKRVLADEGVPEYQHNDKVMEIVLKLDYEILGKGNEWSSSAYDWVTNFKDKEYFLKICEYAGYREDPTKNRFRKGDVRYLVPIFSRTNSTISEEKKRKLEKELASNSILDLGAEEFREFVQKIKGTEKIPWSSIRASLADLRLRVESITQNLDRTREDRNKFREEVGEALLSQISAALQLCVISNEDDFNYGYELAKKQEFNKKPKSQNSEYLDLLKNMKKLLKDFNLKKKLLQKSDYYDYEQLSSKLDALKSEKDFEDFFKRKEEISKIFG